MCAERLRHFARAKAGLGAFLKSKETEFSPELADKLWNSVAAQFQKLESDLERASDDQLAAACEGGSQHVAALIGPDDSPVRGSSDASSTRMPSSFMWRHRKWPLSPIASRQPHL
jgi:hypothetical protein